MTRFAEGTAVPIEKSRSEIEKMIRRYGATETAHYEAPGRAVIMFVSHDRQVRFTLTYPNIQDDKFAIDGRRHRRTAAKRQEAWDQACRQLWRALCLVIKAKLEAVESGIVTFEDEFLAHIVMPDGRTVGDYAAPAIARMYDSGEMLPLLPPPGGNR